MHLLEACLAWLTRVDNSHFSRVAHELIGLFARKFLDKSSFMLFEFLKMTYLCITMRIRGF
jgi:mannose/cellobiose epimerase-like protein (N-acyl-D-glucosamine 2-epimerase family)